MKNDDLLIDKMLKAFDRATYGSGKILDPDAWWPINFLFYSPLFNKVSSQSFCSDYRLLRKSKTLKEIALAFQYPTAAWLALSRFIFAVKAAELNKKERLKIILEFLRILENLMVGGIFCEDKRNVIWSESKVRRLVRETPWIDIRLNPNLAKLFARFHGDLLSMDEAIFWNAVCATRETHGPYIINWKNTPAQLIVREYYNLKEPEFLPSGLSSPYKAIKTFTIYNTAVHFDFPVLNDYTHDFLLVENTLAVFGFVQKRIKKEVLNDEKLVIKVCKAIEEETLKIGLWVESLSKKEQVIESIKRVYYRMKPIRDLLGKRWQAPITLLEQVRKEFPSFKPKTARAKMTRKQFYVLCDPRIDP
jgi:hypothetical protein